MDTQMIESKFARMGARAKVASAGLMGPVRVDIGRDRKGEFFDIQVRMDGLVDVNVIDLRPRDRHLLLMVDDLDLTLHRPGGESLRQKFLCGHDERSWFVAAVPERAHASNVVTAMEALKPAEVRDVEAKLGLGRAERLRRKNRAFIRQGEWFFVPRPGLRVDPKLVLRHEPIRRGGGKAHILEMCYRSGGEGVYVSVLFPNGLTDEEYREWVRRTPSDRQRRVRWNRMVRNAGVFAKGTVRHPDHNTITLHEWHLVQMNTETQAQAMQHVAFLD